MIENWENVAKYEKKNFFIYFNCLFYSQTNRKTLMYSSWAFK